MHLIEAQNNRGAEILRPKAEFKQWEAEGKNLRVKKYRTADGVGAGGALRYNERDKRNHMRSAN